jgi:BirA family biotin operon repressor/biotin-[acetyl-CoA-carboxylase] ligase
MRTLADGRCHSGESLGKRFGVTRAAVWKHVAKLEQWGLDVAAVPGAGYRLAAPLDLLDAHQLRGALRNFGVRQLERLDLFTELDSTNRHLLQAPRPEAGALTACMAEYQSAGRGRRGRSWNAPLASGLCLSAGWQFADTPPDLTALPLAIGVVARRVLARLCGVEVELKWPNDLVFEERKLGGILVEIVAEAQGGCYLVAGLGINVAMPPQRLALLSDWPRGAVDLAQATKGNAPRRTVLAAAMLAELAELFARYATSGFAPYAAEFKDADFLAGKRISIEGGTAHLDGTGRGIGSDGALLVETASGVRQRVISGDVSVRAAQ